MLYYGHNIAGAIGWTDELDGTLYIRDGRYDIVAAGMNDDRDEDNYNDPGNPMTADIAIS